MTKLTRISLALLAIGLVMWVGYVAQGSFVDENGILKEAFPLLACLLYTSDAADD